LARDLAARGPRRALVSPATTVADRHRVLPGAGEAGQWRITRVRDSSRSLLQGLHFPPQPAQPWGRRHGDPASRCSSGRWAEDHSGGPARIYRSTGGHGRLRSGSGATAGKAFSGGSGARLAACASCRPARTHRHFSPLIDRRTATRRLFNRGRPPPAGIPQTGRDRPRFLSPGWRQDERAIGVVHRSSSPAGTGSSGLDNRWGPEMTRIDGYFNTGKRPTMYRTRFLGAPLDSLPTQPGPQPARGFGDTHAHALGNAGLWGPLSRPDWIRRFRTPGEADREPRGDSIFRGGGTLSRPTGPEGGPRTGLRGAAAAIYRRHITSGSRRGKSWNFLFWRHSTERGH